MFVRAVVKSAGVSSDSVAGAGAGTGIGDAT